MAADNYGANSAFDTAEVIQHVGISKLLTACLRQRVRQAWCRRGSARRSAVLGPISGSEWAKIVGVSPLGLRYRRTIGHESARELLAARAEPAAKASAQAAADDTLFDMNRYEYRQARHCEPHKEQHDLGRATEGRASCSDAMVDAFGKSLALQVGTKAGQAIVRSVLDSLFLGR